jgi:signal transduction histidine kinase
MFLTAACVGGVAVVAVLVRTGPLGDIPVAYSYPLLAALYAAAGLVAWSRRPGNRLGPLMLCGAAAWLVGGMQNTAVAPLIGTGKVLATLPLSVVVHLLHACPSGRLRNRAARVVVGFGYVVGVVLEAPLWAFGPEPPPFDAVLISPRPDLAETGYHVQQWCGLALVVATLWLLAQRLREYTAAQRTMLAPMFVYGIIALLSIPVGSNLLIPVLGVERTVALQVVTLTGVPAGLVVVMLRGGFARTAELGSLVTSVASSGGSRQELQDAVARTLGDPSAEVLRWSPDADSYRDLAGRRAELPAPGALRASVAIDLGHRHLGALIFDSQLTVDPALPTAVGRVVGIALDRQRLAEEASDSRDALREASARLLEESDRVRRRIAQDLHDGLQVSLVTLSMQAHRIAQDADGAPVGQQAGQLAAEVDRAAASLRALVHGVMPPPLVERGLAAAVQELAYQVPLRIRLEVDDVPADLSAPVESTAYFVVAEALTNVLKHAEADKVEVVMHVTDGALHISVDDDGRGGATGTSNGMGLTGLADRLQVLGGSLEITSGATGTRLAARIPCE